MSERWGRPVVGQPGSTFEQVRRIAVLRGGGLGDLLFALPAMAALKDAYPEAELTLLGTPMHAALLSNRPGPVDHVEVLPVSPGVRDGAEDPAAKAEFFARMGARDLDLAVQVHGGGRNSNPFLLELGARHTVGTRTPDAAELERTIPYVYYQHEVLRALEVVGLAGALPVDLEPYVELTGEEARARDDALAGPQPLLLVHPGATDPRRRWPVASFGEVAARVAADGARVVVLGNESDAETADAIVAHAQRHGAAADLVSSVAGQVPLGSLVGLLAQGSVLLANDSGPRHLAQAIGTPTVGVYWFGNVINAAPLSRAQHRFHMAWTTRCPTCGLDCTQVGWTAERCEHDDSFVAEVGVDAVLDDVADLMAKKALPHGR